VTIRVESLVDIEVKQLVSIMYEIELYTEWFPFCRQARLLKPINRCAKAAYLRMNLPMVTDREVYLLGFGVDLISESGTFQVCCRSLQEDPKFLSRYDI
jgi:hypothetical protein